MSVVGMIKRTFTTLNKEMFLTLYYTLDLTLSTVFRFRQRKILMYLIKLKTCYEISSVYKEFKLRTKTWIFGTIFTIEKTTKR